MDGDSHRRFSDEGESVVVVVNIVVVVDKR